MVGITLDAFSPTQRRYYYLFPLLSGACVGGGALLLSLDMGPLAIYNAAAWGLIAGGTALNVAIHAIGNERAAWFEYRREVEAHQPYPERDPDTIITEAPRILNTPKGPGYIDPVRKAFVMLKTGTRGFAKRTAYTQQAEIIGRVVVQNADEPNAGEFVNTTAGMWRLARYGGGEPNKSTADTEWTGDGKPFSKPEWHALRNWLIENNLAFWKNPRAGAPINDEKARKSGWIIRPRTKAILRCIDKQFPTCPPPGQAIAGVVCK